MVLGGAMGLSMLTGLGSGFAFGTGYGAGVRFGYEDVYPYLKGNMSQIATMLQIPFASSGFKLASGVTARQGMGLQDAEAITGERTQGLGLEDPALGTPEVSAGGRRILKNVLGKDWSIHPEWANKAINPFNGPTHYAIPDGDEYELWVKAGDRYRIAGKVLSSGRVMVN